MSEKPYTPSAPSSEVNAAASTAVYDDAAHDASDDADEASNDEEDDPSLLLGSVTDDFSADFNLSPPSRIVRAEAVLAHRTSALVLVLESMIDSLNHQAVLRTAEAMGIQHIYTVDTGLRKAYTVKGGLRVRPTVTTGSSKWLSVHSYPSTEDCIAALQEAGYVIWATDLSPAAHPLTSAATPRPLPARLAIVMGREVDGVSPAMLAAAERRVYLPQFGFTESFNVSVATALVLQRLLDLAPEWRGKMGEEERAELRDRWYRTLAPRVERREDYGQWVERGNRGEIEWKEADLRPKEECRLPRVTPRQRQKMLEKGEREVLLAKGAVGAGDEQKHPT